MDFGDIIHITIELRHHQWRKGTWEYVQESHANAVLPVHLNVPNLRELQGDMLERQARKAIDMLLQWREENHKHDDSN